jgi:hypothetical protein
MQNEVFDIPFELAAPDVVRVNRIRLGALTVLAMGFFWLAHILIVFMVAALLNTVIEIAWLCLLGGSATSILLGQYVKREFDRWELERASKAASQIIVGRLVVNRNGLSLIENRTTTNFGWEDFSQSKNHGSDIQLLLRGGGDLFVPARLFRDHDQFSNFTLFVEENINSQISPLN